MKYKAILFGSIGTLIESSNIQRNSFNEAFKEAGLDWYWDEQDYKILLKKSGGTKRVEDFDFIGNKSFVKNEKPHPEIYKITLDKLNLHPEDCLAIEDTEESSNSAVNAGIKCIGFPGDYHLEDNFQMCIKKRKYYRYCYKF